MKVANAGGVPSFQNSMRRGLALIFLTACSTPYPPPASVAAVGWIEGESFPIAQSWVFAEDNENVHWSAMLESPVVFPREFGSDLRAAWVEIGGARHAVTGIGGSPQGVFFHLQSDRAGALELAAALGVSAMPRLDPGCALRASLIPAREPAPPGEPQFASFVLTNAGTRPVVFTRRSSMLSSERDEDFDVQVLRQGSPLPRRADPVDLGGLRQTVTLAPGESTVFELDLAAWASFDKGGRYRIQAHYRLTAEPPERSRSQVYAQAHQLWDVAVLAECDVTIG